MGWELIERGEIYSRYRTSTGSEVRIADARFRGIDPDSLPLDELWDEFTGTRGTGGESDFREYLDVLGVTNAIAWCEHGDEPVWQYDLDNGRRTLDGNQVCAYHIEEYYSYCESCDGWYHLEDEDDHNHYEVDDGSGCCDSPQPDFAIRNDGQEPLANDTRLTVTLPAGVISDQGLTEIVRYLHQVAGMLADRRENLNFRNMAYEAYEIGSQWQTKDGNFTKRLSRKAYQDYKIKLSPKVLSQVGVIARDHSKAVDVTIDVTRDLNNSPGYFYHEGSCWWDGFTSSRCALKTNGGFGLRSLDTYGSATGRAWVMPLKLQGERLVPTFNTLTPDAFVVFNGYGDLESYAAPRIMASLAGWTYKKISFAASPMYINAGGYLVGPEDIVQKTGDLRLSLNQHASLYDQEEEYRKEPAAA